MAEGGGEGINGPKWQKILSISLCISGTVHHMIMIFGAHVKWYLQLSLFFQNSDFRVEKGQEMTQNYQIQSVMLHNSRVVGHINIFCTQV